jgi:lysine biosynthesis protein LysW
MAECPGCGSTVVLSKGVKVGDRIDCECGEELEVISLKPLELDYAFDDEDWEEAEDEEWEEEEA